MNRKFVGYSLPSMVVLGVFLVFGFNVTLVSGLPNETTDYFFQSALLTKKDAEGFRAVHYEPLVRNQAAVEVTGSQKKDMGPFKAPLAPVKVNIPATDLLGKSHIFKSSSMYDGNFEMTVKADKEPAGGGVKTSITQFLLAPAGGELILQLHQLMLDNFKGPNQPLQVAIRAMYSNDKDKNVQLYIQRFNGSTWTNLRGVQALKDTSALSTSFHNACALTYKNADNKKILAVRIIVAPNQGVTAGPNTKVDDEIDLTAKCDDSIVPDPDGYDGSCGDNTINGGEQCDDGNDANGDGCSQFCTQEAVMMCGNYMIEGFEFCDGGTSDSMMCDNDCTDVECGDNHMNTSAGEFCDDGNTTGGDGCSATCTMEICGNYVTDTGEQCDSGGYDSMTCDNNCTMPVCGDGHTNTSAGETCDDGNTTNGDGCSSTCQMVMCGNYICEAGESNMTCPMDCWY